MIWNSKYNFQGVTCRGVTNEKDFKRSKFEWVFEHRVLNVITNPRSQILFRRSKVWNNVTV